MNNIVYLYLDDQDPKHTLDLADGISIELSDLEIIVREPYSFGRELLELKKAQIDGLILDLRLDESSEAEYRAFSLGQELRTLATENEFKDIPIVVCSTLPKLKKSYTKDSTGHDIFDRKYLKDVDMVDQPNVVANELKSLVLGYRKIHEIRKKRKNSKNIIIDSLGVAEENIKHIDERLLFHFGATGILPVHEYARFLLKEVVLRQGLLVDTSTVACRLGIDPTSLDYEKFLSKNLEKFKYSGPFGETWIRYWWFMIEDWWAGLKLSKESLSFIGADEKVALLSKYFKLTNLKAANAIHNSYSQKFWAICELYKQPVDPFDAFMIDSGYEPLVWQESKYISIKGAFDSKVKLSEIQIHPLEHERFKELKALGYGSSK